MARGDERRAKLRARVAFWSGRLKVKARVVRVQRMTRKWGSCSTAGTVTLADDLAARPAGFQDYVVVHELLHLRVPNHGRVFKALLSAHVPGWRRWGVARSTQAGPAQ